MHSPLPQSAHRTAILESSLLRITLIAAICLGVLLAVLQYFYNRSLWLDEASLAINILDRSFLRLLRPLSYLQVAPVGFLFAEKGFVLSLGEHAYALRLFPLLCYLATLPVYYLATRNLTNDSILAALCTAVLSLSYYMIYFSSEIKQYMSDVLIATIFLLIASKRSAGQGVLLMVFGSVAIWFSNIAILYIFLIGSYLLWQHLQQRQPRMFFVSLALTCVSFGIYFLLFIHGHPSTAYMQDYWQSAFLSSPGDGKMFLASLLRAAKEIFVRVYTFDAFWWIPAVLSLAGIVIFCVRRQTYILFLSLAPLGLHLVLSAFHLYPFAGRLLLYLLPGLIWILMSGMYYPYTYIRQYVRLPAMILLIPVLVMLYPLSLRFPIERAEIKKGLRLIEEQIQPGELVYTYDLTRRAMAYYQLVGFTSLQSPRVENVVFSQDSVQFRRNLLAMRGKAWFLVSHISSSAPPDFENGMLAILEQNGTRIMRTWKFTGCRVYYLEREDVSSQ